MCKRILSSVLVLFILLATLPFFEIAVKAETTGMQGKTIATTHRHQSFVIKQDGSLWAWGVPTEVWLDNRFGLSHTDVAWNTHTKIMEDVITVSASAIGGHIMAIRTDGGLYAWGFNDHGKLGDGTHTRVSQRAAGQWVVYENNDRRAPVRVLDDVVDVSAGNNFTFAIRSDGSLWGWGIVYRGNGLWEVDLTPVRIMDNVVAVSAGNMHVMAIRADGGLYAWGANHVGQLGDGTTTGRHNPIRIMDNVAKVSADFERTLAVQTDGSLWAWGDNMLGQLGDGTTTNRYSPVRIMDNVASVSHGHGHSMAIRTDGSLWTWGSNMSGSLGDGTFDDRLIPAMIMDNVISVSSTGLGHVLAIRTDASLWVWGVNNFGELGDETIEVSNIPVKIMEGVMLPGQASHLPPTHTPTPPASDGTTIIRTADELAAIGGEQSAGRTFVLANDISATNWQPIEDFRGTLDGAGHTVTLTSRASQNFATAGLLADISEGTVIIRNLSVKTSLGGSISARAPNSSNSRSYAGGLIGAVVGGEVTIENVSFDGIVGASSTYDRFMASLNRSLESLFLGTAEAAVGVADLAGQLPKWVSNVSTSIKIVELAIRAIINRNLDEINRSGSRAYAGGLIGFIGGEANVRIANSFASGRVSSRADSGLEMSTVVGAVRARAYSGGLVGLLTGNARLIIENSYVTNDVQAWALAPVFGRPDSLAGSLVGRDHGGATTIVGSNFSLNDQSLITNRGAFPNLARGPTNTNGITRALSQAQMRNSNSFTGWDFNNVWAIDSTRNNGFPFPLAASQGFATGPIRPFSTFSEGFTSTIGSGESLTLEIDMPFASFNSVQVNDMPLTQDVHFTVTSGSTQITLLPEFLDTLEDGVHTLTVNFADGVSVEEQFLVMEAKGIAPVSRLYHDGVLVFSVDEGGLLVDEDYFDSLPEGYHNFRAVFADGQVIDEDVFMGDSETIFENDAVSGNDFPAISVAIVIIIAVGTGVLIAKGRKLI